ncbi:hypothetical protein R3P38DRAFT_3070339 [Favolaschia claudopus]|uniref:RING-type E3 ubiquitin transferase n=1 Tax=Favolaschia claudopus TaxID=2862362 RepID=A0AAW0A096_9AGAR
MQQAEERNSQVIVSHEATAHYGPIQSDSSTTNAAPTQTTIISSPFANYRHFMPNAGNTDALAIDVDEWDALPALDVDAESNSDNANNPLPLAIPNSLESGQLVRFRCCICYDTFNMPVVTLCLHIFCDACLSRWCSEPSGSSECPVCRGSVVIPGIAPFRCGIFENDLKEAIETGIISAPTIPPRINPYTW